MWGYFCSLTCNVMGKPLFKITNKSADTIEIDIEGPIGGYVVDWEEWSVKSGPTKEKVKALVKEIANSAASHIIVNINSYGGDVNHGISIHDILAEHKAKVTTIVHGHTASAATIIAQAGDTRKMSANALYLIHPASTVAWGNLEDFKAAMSDLEKVDNTISSIYAKRTGKSQDEIMEVMNRFDGRGEWLTAQEALDLGLIDEIFEPMKAAASADPELLNKFGLPALPTNKIDNMKADKKTVFAWFEEFLAKIGKPAAEAPEETEQPEEGDPGAEEKVEETPEEQPQAVVISDMEEVRQVLDDLTSQNADLTTRLQAAEDEVARLKGLPTATKDKDDPVLDNPTKTNADANEANARSLRER